MYIQNGIMPKQTLYIDEIGQIAGISMENFFLKFKKELIGFGCYAIMQFSENNSNE